ncbi:MAG: tetratricopeptide repeat protein [Desulfobacteraceae bacterium]|nr:tetratricopeptide repeat protein [Desulfobacteraceae bacterium]
MSLIVDVLKIAQRDGVAKGPLPPFVKYPYEEGLRLRAFISKHTWLFRVAIGFSMLMILAVFVMTSHDRKSNPRADVSHKTIATITPPSQEYSVAPAEAELSEDKSTPVQKEKAQVPPSSKHKNTKSGDEPSPSGKILVEEKTSHGIRNHFELAVSYQKRGEKAKAMEEYRKVIEIDPLNVESHNNLGVIYKDMGRLNQAVKEFQTVLSMNPGHEKAHNNLGIIFYLQGNLQKAIQEFRGVLDVNAKNIAAYINLGVIYKRQNRIGKARRMLANALSIDPYCTEAHYNLALVCEENGHIKEAISHYQEFIKFAGNTHHELAARVKRHLETLSQSQK